MNTFFNITEKTYSRRTGTRHHSANPKYIKQALCDDFRNIEM